MAHKTPVILSVDKLLGAIITSFLRLAPTYQIRNPVIFAVYIGAIISTIDLFVIMPDGPILFTFIVSLTLWFTVLFANYAEAVVEERGKLQVSAFKRSRADYTAKKIESLDNPDDFTLMPASSLQVHDHVLLRAGDVVPTDGQVVRGIATVDESAVTGESAPVIREPDGERDAVTGGTRILSDWIIIKTTASHGDSYLDQMSSLVDGAKRQKTPTEIALGLFLVALTISFLACCATALPFADFALKQTGQGQPIGLSMLIALFVCFVPTTICGLLSPAGLAGMNHLLTANVIATSGRAIEAIGDISVLLIDKTGTITFGNRQAVSFYPAAGVSPTELVNAALLSSLSDMTPEGKSIVTLARRQYNITHSNVPEGLTFIPFSADTRISGVTYQGHAVFKGADDAIADHIRPLGGTVSPDIHRTVELIARQGGTPLLVSDNEIILGVIHLKDIVKAGIKDRIASLRLMGVKSVMVTGDNPLTAAAIAAEAGVDDFIAQATPETKLKYIRRMQEQGELIAMVGDGTNDAPALAQADVGIAMNSGTQAAKEAANMIDLDSNPTKLIDIVRIGRQILMTRGSLTTFSLTSDVAKYFAALPAAFITLCPWLDALNFMNLSTPENAVLASLIFNAIVIAFLIPLALRGVTYRPHSADRLLQRNLLVYGLGGLIIPFGGIKLIDMLLNLLTQGTAA